MPFFLVYLLKVSVSLSVVFLFYHLVLQRLTFYNWNRWYLLVYSFTCFLVPFIDISPVLERNAWSDNGLVQWVPVMYQSAAGQAVTGSGSLPGFWDITAYLLITGMTIMMLRLLVQFISYYRLTKRAVLLSDEKMRIYQVNDAIAPFSFGRSVFINRELHSASELREIIRHEFVHIRQKHSLDIIWSEIVCLICWFNPFAWLLKKAIRQNLEFIADNKVLANGISRKEYQYLLLKVTGNHQYSIATPFSFSSLKKRIAMMNKIKSAKVNLLRFLFMLPLLAVILVSFRKQIGDRLAGMNSQLQETALFPTDTIPGAITPNSKGYFLKIKGREGQYEVRVTDAKGNEVKRIPLSEWELKSDYYEDLYGQVVTAPPPPPPAPAAPPSPKKMPEGVEKLDMKNKKLTVTLKDGTRESYDLSVPSEKEAFEKKYGDILPGTPAPPPVPAAPGLQGATAFSPDAAEWEVSDKKAVIRFRDGRQEVYDLRIAKQKNAFIAKYGRPVLATTVAPAAPETPVVAFEGLSSTAPVPAIAGINGGVTVTAPMAADEAVTIAGVDDYGHTITGNEDILVTITRNTTRRQLDAFILQMKEKDIDLSYDEIEYNEDGRLVKLTGTLQSKKGRSNFVAVDFNTLTLAMIRKGEKTYFKVNVNNNKKVI